MMKSNSSKKINVLRGLLPVLLLLPTAWLSSQTDTTSSWSGEVYIETYYGYDFGQPDHHNRPNFIYSHHRHNEFNLNIGLAQLNYHTEKARGHLGLMIGTYPNKNMEHEPVHYRNIYQANVGVRLSKFHNLWLDIGVLESHIGFEGAQGAKYGFMTRSLLADNSPYYSAGAELSFHNTSETFILKGLLLNGWQNIQRISGNQSIAGGHQLLWTPSDLFTLNSSSFVGNVYPQENKRMRYFHNLYALIKTKKIEYSLGLDLGIEQASTNSANYSNWTGAILGVRYFASNQFTVGLRSEYFQDKDGVIITAPKFMNSLGLSLNVDYSLQENSLVRLEFKGFKNESDIYTYRGDLVSYNLYIGASFCFFITHTR